MGIYEELQARGLIAQVTNEPEIREMIKSYTRQYPDICDKWENDVE